MKILIIEDENQLSESILAYLEKEKYVCETASDFREAQEKIGSYQYDCILLDITLPDGSGLTLLEQLKSENKLDGVIIISAKNSLDDRIEGLNLGADDYLPKPFHLSELGARIAAIIRRKQFQGANKIMMKELSIDVNLRKVSVFSEEVSLTRKEFDLLLFLISNKNRLVSKNAIAEHLSGDDADMFDNYDFIYAHMKNMKKKLMEAGCADYFKTIYGLGYKFEA